MKQNLLCKRYSNSGQNVQEHFQLWPQECQKSNCFLGVADFVRALRRSNQHDLAHFLDPSEDTQIELRSKCLISKQQSHQYLIGDCKFIKFDKIELVFFLFRCQTMAYVETKLRLCAAWPKETCDGFSYPKLSKDDESLRKQVLPRYGLLVEHVEAHPPGILVLPTRIATVRVMLYLVGLSLLNFPEDYSWQDGAREGSAQCMHLKILKNLHQIKVLWTHFWSATC